MLEFFKKRQIILIVFSVLVAFLLGAYLGASNRPAIEKVAGIANKENPSDIKADMSPFWKTWNVLNEKYPDAGNISDQDRVNGAISGLVSSLNDPYTVFFNPEEKKAFEEDISGSFSGIGIEVGMKDKILTVISPLKDTPAYKAGIKAGDKILKIGDTMTSDLSIDEAIKIMRGDKGTEVLLTILREGEDSPREVRIVRDIINVPTLDTEIRADGVFVIKLYSFSANSAKLFKDALIKFNDAKTNKLVLDLRGNPGGYLDAAVSMASWFLPGGKTVLIEDYGNNAKQKVYRSEGYDIFNDNLKFVILIDGGSASASEILAGALQDNHVAKLVGEQSYGKGSVQEVVDITPDSILKVTIAKWLTPNGVSISEKGLTPDYKADITTDDIKNNRDPQMDKAIEVLNNWVK